MVRSRLHLIVLVAVAAWRVGMALSAAVAAESWDAPSRGVLVLRNGQILEGRITPTGDKYLVTLGESIELRVPVRDVAMRCASLDEVYRRKRAALPSGDAVPHLELAEWCLNHDLLSAAADQVLEAFRIDPKNPRIAALERQLRAMADRTPSSSGHQAGHPARASLEELERTMRELPAGEVEAFTSQIQPLLLNHCGANTCHGARSDASFRLVRPSWGKSLARRFTQRNLYAALRHIDREAPEKSSLIVAAGSPHGNVENSVFGKANRRQFELLADWLRRLGSDPNDAAPQAVPTASPQVAQASYTQPAGAPAPPRPAGSGADLPSPDGSRDDSERSQRSPGAGFVPRDPFDPEIFNRRFVSPVDHPAAR